MIDVAAAIIWSEGKVLIARRKYGRHSGKWEFPGGKIKKGESPEEALKREFQEEFGSIIKVQRFFLESRFLIEGDPYRLLAYRAVHCSGELLLTDHDRIEWVRPESLAGFDLAEPDIPIAEKLVA